MKGPGVVIGLLGPTGVGKTGVAVELAQTLRTPVISCDSMQVYRGFPVLTNQPSPEQMNVAPHELVGCAGPLEAFSAVQYAALARPLIEQHLSEFGWALVVGGTGLYMRAALASLSVGPAADAELRADLETRARAEGGEALHAELTRRDPAAAQRIDPHNVRRVIRALEALLATGRSWSGRDDLWAPVYDHPTVVVGLTVERQELHRRIDTRAARITKDGGIDEVRLFRREHGAEQTRPGGAGVRSAIGYPEICLYLEGTQTIEETVDQIAGATRRYARRQATWLRKVEGAVMIDVGERRPSEIAREIITLAESGGYTKEPRRA